ncbi:uncharacterized protein LOC135644083 [Musa acuminata AAA Group]|uniref:(wild Malaysian banana) hypothetical protein n=1 Tax=Musa acuminata subsp. malaccensis TaxID=214687 RepID=A0A804K7C6_MUSAM|nr:PREDICTED: uncharacterized protein LOC103994556 [Musa acuminata subsp. malaccensis]CAG1831735.1 unnamed protein product [Musa acuminata subsp. malaccensis]
MVLDGGGLRKATAREMERQKVVVVVEEADAARTALLWAVRNFIRGGDSITLLYVCPSTRSKRKQRNYRLKGFQLALSFKDLCNGIAEAKVEIIVTEGDQGALVVSTVTNVGASTLVVGLHDKSFLYKAPITNIGTRSLNCRILAIKQHSTTQYGLLNTDFSQVETTRLCISESRNLFPIFPLSLRMFFGKSKRRKC